jgi:F-box protein 9
MKDSAGAVRTDSSGESSETALQPDIRRLALIESELPIEMVLEIFHRLPISAIGKCLCVSQAWRKLGGEEFLLWKRLCERVFREEPTRTLQDAYAMATYGGWRGMFLERPRLRQDGVYVSRNTYVRTGVSEWRREKPVHLCLYFRYLRFLPKGRFVYRTSPMVLKHVVKSLTDSNEGKSKNDREKVHIGRYRLIPQSGVVQTAFRYPNSFSTEVRSKLKLRGTAKGAFNRLDILQIVTYDRERDVSLPMMRLDVEDDEAEIPGMRRDHRTTDVAYVFVPFEEATTHVLNLGVEHLDYWVPG